MNNRNLVVISLDALSSEDYTLVSSLPVLGSLIREGAVIRRLKGIYPTQTYPLHATMLTGTGPEAHGIISNTTLDPGNPDPEWRQYRKEIRVPTLYDEARAHGIDTAAFLWPVAAGARIRYNLPELPSTSKQRGMVFHVLASGTPLFILDIQRRFGKLRRGFDREALDNFTTASAAWTIGRKNPGLVLLHLLDLDHTRHRTGFMNDDVRRVLEQEDRRTGQVLEAIRNAGLADSTNIVVIGDHGQKDVRRDIHINEAFRQSGLVLTDGKGRVTAWSAWANSCDGSAQVYITDHAAEAIIRRIADNIEFEGKKVIRAVFGKDDIERLGLGTKGPDFILEAEDGFAFAADIGTEILTEPVHRATHGYLPDTYFSLCIASGPDIGKGEEIREADIIDICPTLARLLGFSMPTSVGKIIPGMLKHTDE